MNSQDILRNLGIGLDIVLDNSETYDYEISTHDNDYDGSLIIFGQTHSSYENPKIVKDLTDDVPIINSITLTEVDNTVNDPNYIYSGITQTFQWSDFCDVFNITDENGFIFNHYENFQLNNDVFIYDGYPNEIHYFKIFRFNVQPAPDNDLTYTFIPNNDITYVFIPNNDITYTFI